MESFINEECDKYSKLEILPTPDSEFRLIMEFKTIDKYIKPKQPMLHIFIRNDYAVLEWGGINFGSDNRIF